MPADDELVNGPSGVAWLNQTGRVRYQFRADLVRTCGACLQYHGVVGPWWPIPIHWGCRCRQKAIGPGQAAEPFADFRKLLEGMTKSQRAAAVGVGNYRLLRAGLVEWGDVVTASRVRSLRDVLALTRIGRKAALDAGVRPADVDAAAARGVLTEEEMAREHLAELGERLRGLRVSGRELVEALTPALAVAASIAGGLGVQTAPAALAAAPHAAELAAALERWRRRVPGKKPDRRALIW